MDKIKNYEDKLRWHRLCLDLVLPVWNAIEWDKVAPQRRMKIYEELSSKIKSSATTSSVTKFIEKLCVKFDVRSITSARMIQIIEDHDNKKILKTFREDTQIIILLLREKVEERKAIRNIEIPKEAMI